MIFVILTACVLVFLTIVVAMFAAAGARPELTRRGGRHCLIWKVSEGYEFANSSTRLGKQL